MIAMAKLKTRFPRKALLGYRKSGNNQSSQISENKMLRMFLDFLVEDTFKNPSSLTPYTEEMAKEMDELLKGVEIDWD
jgi:antitoxin PrlF